MADSNAGIGLGSRIHERFAAVGGAGRLDFADTGLRVVDPWREAAID